jgi:hypothetical protein
LLTSALLAVKLNGRIVAEQNGRRIGPASFMRGRSFLPANACSTFLRVSVAITVVGCSSRPAAEERIKYLEHSVELQRQESDNAVMAYAPKAVGRLDDLETSAADIELSRGLLFHRLQLNP